jgi:uncharacterized protein HemX
MKRIATFLLLAAFGAGAAAPAIAQPENRRIGENQAEAKRAAKQQQKANKKLAKKNRKAMKNYQKAQKRSAKQQKRRTH